MKTCKIRKDLLIGDVGVPVGEGFYRLPDPLEYRWVNEGLEDEELQAGLECFKAI